GPLVAPRDDCARDIGDRGPDPFASDVHADHPPRHWIELVEEGARASLAARSADLPGEPRLEQSPQREGDSRLGKAAHPRHLRPGDRSLFVDQVENRSLVDRAQEAWRADGDWGWTAQHPVLRPA